MKPVLYLIQKEFRQILRDRAMLRMIFFVPLIQLFVLSYAASTDLKNVRLALLDQDRSAGSRRLAEAFLQSEQFVPGPTAADPSALERLLADGRADVGVWIPRGFEADLVSGRPTRVAITVDGQNSSLAGRAAGYAQAIVREEAARRLSEAALKRPDLLWDLRRVEATTRFFYNPELESRYYMVPGIAVLLISIITGFLSGMAIVREKEVGTLEQLIVSPLTPAQLILGKTVPFVIIAFVDLTLAIAVAMLWFGIPLEGSIILLALSAAVYLLVTLGVGLLASTVSSTQQQAMFTIWFFLVFGLIMSGFFFPIENMPTWAQWITRVNPVRYIMSIMRGVFLKGATLGDVKWDLLLLLVIGAATFSLATLRFQKRLS